MEELNCTECHKLIGYGDGDFYFCAFLCTECKAKAKEPWRINTTQCCTDCGKPLIVTQQNIATKLCHECSERYYTITSECIRILNKSLVVDENISKGYNEELKFTRAEFGKPDKPCEKCKIAHWGERLINGLCSFCRYASAAEGYKKWRDSLSTPPAKCDPGKD